MIYLILGIVIGIILTLGSQAFTFAVMSRWGPKLDRKLKQMDSKLKEKGKVIEPENEQLEDWINNLPSEPNENQN